jgi:hypothetical protein
LVNAGLRVHVFPSDGSKTPQADLSIAADSGQFDCDGHQVSVLNLTTEE